MYDKLTQNDIKRMEEEIEHRILVIRPETLTDVKEARAHGDLSENFEYKAAKKAQRENESRIRHLKRMIKTAQIFEDDSNSDEVGLNDRVTIYYPADKEEETVKIVTTVRSNSLKGRIGMESPLGKALMHHRISDKVIVNVSDTISYEVEIRNIEKLEDTGDDEMRKY